MRTPKLEIREGRDGQFYMSLRAANGAIVADLAEGSPTESAARKRAQRIRRMIEDTENMVIVLESPEAREKRLEEEENREAGA